jgi:sec-independent protein translocase protein TatC
LPTFLDHVRELQSRLFIIGLAFVAACALAVPFFDKIVNILMAPLSPEQKLVYLTPGGAFNFILKVCIYVGIIGTLPVIIFHLYRFLMPVVRKLHLRTALKYTFISIILAAIGILFAYFISLPAALYFLTSFNLYHIEAMLTIDSYLSFVMAYLVAGAALFQLPLVMTIIDSVKPLRPKKLMSYQRYIIVGSFIIAAIITPTPDALNQTIIASPIIIMYQVGVAIVAWRHRKRKPHDEVVVSVSNAVGHTTTFNPTPVLSQIESESTPHLISDIVVTPLMNGSASASIDARQAALERTFEPRSRATPRLVPPTRSIDGIIVPKRA